MFETLALLQVSTADFGPLADIVKYATFAVLAAGGLFVLIRGRSRKWEPADTEVPRLAERAAIAVGAVVTVIVFALMNDRGFIPVLSIAAGVAALLLFAAFFQFLKLSEHYLHDAPHLARGGKHVTQRIIGDDAHLTPAAISQLAGGRSLQDLIWGCGQNFDQVFDRKWRSSVKVRYQMSYFFLVLCFIMILACTGQLLSLAAGPKTQFSFWTRPNADLARLPAIRTFTSLADCLEAQKRQDPAGLADGCGCQDQEPTKEELIRRYEMGDAVAGQFAQLLGYELPLKSVPSVPGPVVTPGQP